MHRNNLKSGLQNKLAETDVAVLGLLAEKPSYGYEIEQRVSSRGMRNWTRMEQSSIYNSLRRLERKGLVRSERKEVDGRLRRIYVPTTEGSKTLAQEVYNNLSIPAKELTNFDLGLCNIYAIGREKAIDALMHYNRALEETISFFDSNAKKMRAFGIPIAAWLFERPSAECRARVQWIREFIEELKKAEFPKINN